STPPGTASHVCVQQLEKVKLRLCKYPSSHADFTTLQKVDDAKKALENPHNTWLDIRGLHDVEKLRPVWSYFKLHPLIQEDIVNTRQRPKMEIYSNCIFFVLQMPGYSQKDKSLHFEQISIILGPDYVLTFRETDADLFQPIEQRLQLEGGRLRTHGTDYLAYALIDTIVDHYFKTIHQLGDEIETAEDRLFKDEDQDENQLQQIHEIRRKVVQFHKAVWPLRNALASSGWDDTNLITEHTKLFLRDVYDHTIQVIEASESYREAALSLQDLYMSNMSNKMNEVMKVLTIIATIFIPLTFIAGIYGMNFNPETSPYNMPELSMYWGYPVALLGMAAIAIIMIVYFKR